MVGDVCRLLTRALLYIYVFLGFLYKFVIFSFHFFFIFFASDKSDGMVDETSMC